MGLNRNCNFKPDELKVTTTKKNVAIIAGGIRDDYQPEGHTGRKCIVLVSEDLTCSG